MSRAGGGVCERDEQGVGHRQGQEKASGHSLSSSGSSPAQSQQASGSRYGRGTKCERELFVELLGVGG